MKTLSVMHRLLILLFLSVITLPGQAQEMLVNHGFGGGYSGTATSWSTNIWNGAAATTTRETNNVKSGSSAQKFDITSLGSGGGAIRLQAVTTVPGHSYRASLWVRGSIGMRVQLQLRQPGQNYRTIATDTITFISCGSRAAQLHSSFPTLGTSPAAVLSAA